MSAGGATLLTSIKVAFYILEPTEKVSVSMINERKVKYLKYLWISKPTVNIENNGYGGNSDGQFVKSGMYVTMNVDLSQGSNVPVTVCQYRVLGIYKNITINGC